MAAPQLAQSNPQPSLQEALAHYNRGDGEVARALFEAYLEKDPLNVEALVGLGLSTWRIGDGRQAQAILEKALTIQPTNDSALRGLGLVLYGCFEFQRALDVIKRGVDLAPNNPQGWLTLGLIHQRLEDLVEAERSFSNAWKLNPRYAEAMNNLGTVFLARKDFGRARALFMQAMVEKPTLIDAYRSLSKLLREVGADHEALVVLKRGLKVAPRDANTWNDLGGLYRDMSDMPRSIAAYRSALECNPNYVDARANLSCVLATDGDYKGAYDACTELLAVDPEAMGVRLRRSLLLPAMMESNEAVAEARQRVDRALDELLEHKGIIQDPLGQVGATNFYLAYHGFNERDLQKRIAELFLKVTPCLNHTAEHIGKTRTPGKIRIGLCSRHLSQHTIGILWAELFARLDRNRFDISLFYTQPHRSRISKSLLERVDRSFQLPMNIPQSQKIVGSQQLDVMYYPDIGMEPLTYFLAFSRLAPVQCVTWGHPLTTGIPNIDYFISSKELEIEGSQNHYSEELVLLDTLNTYYLQPEARVTLTRQSLGVGERSTLYVCPQTLFKFHPDYDAMIGRILREDRNGELVLLDGTCARHTELLLERFKRTIPDVLSRIRIVRRLTHEEFLALVSMADVMLDPIHFGGGSTTIQALSFGTPVVTLPSEFLRGRISYACYRHMGVDSLIAKDADDYCAMALKLGQDKDVRDETRALLREKSGVLFSNQRVITESEHFFERVVKKHGGEY